MSDTDEETSPFEFNHDSEVENETFSRKHHKSCKDQSSVWAVLCVAVVIVAMLAFVGLAVRISNRSTQESNGELSDPNDSQEASGELPSDPYERALALLTDYPLVDG